MQGVPYLPYLYAARNLIQVAKKDNVLASRSHGR
jgi:hypothetical protein